MDALKIKTIFWQKEWKIPGTSWHIKGYSRSAFRTGFYLSELELMLDAGPQNFNHPKTTMITHTHIDHIASLPFTMIGHPEIFQIYGPSAAEEYIANYIQAMFSVNALEKISNNSDQWWKYHPLSGGDQFEICLNKTNLQIEVFKCDHTIPTISYGLAQFKDKLKNEYLKLTGKEIASLRREGTQITHRVLQKKLAYVCDTSIEVFKLNPTLLTYPVIFIECTFFMSDELENAAKTNHIHWYHLRPFVLNHPDTHFMLFHFSQRYRDQEIVDFFEAEIQQDHLKNLSYWVNI